jgi:hypothetical protein
MSVGGEPSDEFARGFPVEVAKASRLSGLVASIRIRPSQSSTLTSAPATLRQGTATSTISSCAASDSGA